MIPKGIERGACHEISFAIQGEIQLVIKNTLPFLPLSPLTLVHQYQVII